MIKPSVISAGEKRLLINSSKILYHEKSIDTPAITQIAESLTQVKSVLSTLGNTYLFEMKNEKGERLEFGFTSFMNPGGSLDLYAQIHAAMKNAVYQRMVNEFDKKIAAGEIIKTGQVEIAKEGITSVLGLIFKKREFISWKDLGTNVENGNLNLFSKSNPKIKGQIMLHWWNAVVFRILIEGRTF